MDVPVCQGTITFSHGGSVARCQTGWTVQPLPQIQPFDLSQLDYGVLGQMFGVGFVIFAVPWVSAWGLYQLLDVIRRS